MRTTARRAGLLAIGSLATILTLAGTPQLLDGLPTTTALQAQAPQVLQLQAQPQNEVNPAVTVFERNERSVVNVNSLAVARVRGMGPVERQQGVGSGFVIDEQGHIVTNNHVIEQADQLSVTLPLQDRQITVPAQLIGRDPVNDLAVVKVDPNATVAGGQRLGEVLQPVTLGAIDQVRVGQTAIAMGAPLGLSQTVTSGIVSAIRAPASEPALGLELLGGAIQTDTPINPGNSGGPLFNAQGEVIGVNTAILSGTGGSIGLGFAIPVDVVRRVVPELIQQGCYRHPLVGVSALPLSALGQAARRELGIPLDQQGLLVQDVQAGAAEAGLQAGDRVVTLGGEQIRVGGDIIVAVDGRQVSSGGELLAYIENNKRPGDEVTLTVLRNGERQEITVTLSQRPSEACPNGAAS